MLRAFLGPLFAWTSACPPSARLRLPVMLRTVVNYVTSEIDIDRMRSCRDPVQNLGEMFRVDAKAEGNDVVIGGWATRGEGGQSHAACFSIRLTRGRSLGLH